MNEIQVLMVEDSPIDAKLILYSLKNSGLKVQHERVQDAGSMREALLKKSWDLILSDYTMPQFSGEAALALLKKTGMDIPLSWYPGGSARRPRFH